MAFRDIHDVNLINNSLQECKNIMLDCSDLCLVDEECMKNIPALRFKNIITTVLEKHEIEGIDKLPCDMIFMDENGIVVYGLDGNRDAPGLLYPGVSLLEANAGTSGFSLAVKYKKPFWVRGDEHYLQIFKNCVSYALPLVIDQNQIGFIGFLAREDIFNNPMGEILINLARLTGDVLVKCYREMCLSGKLKVIQQYFTYVKDDVGLIALTKDFMVLSANKHVLKMLGLEYDEIYEKNLDEVLGPGYRPYLEAGSSRINNLKLNTPGGEVNCKVSAEKVMAANEIHVGWILELSLIHARDLAVNQIPRYDFSYIVGDNTDLLRCVNLGRVVANGNSNVLITGESGTGKEVFAQAIHYASQFKDGPFIAINTSAIPAELMESELFGYTDGAFTGAKKTGMNGKFYQANNGTIFLDEIGDMPVEVQPKLLRVLQDRRITPLGGDKSIDLNIRIISATNQNLQELIKQGKFRSDLYYRLNVVEIEIPPLRERSEDIPTLAEYFLEKFSSRLNKKVLELSPDAVELLKAYRWPGNVRELENVIESAVNLSTGKTLDVKHLPVQIIREGNNQLLVMDNEEKVVGSLLEMEKLEIMKALQIYNGNIKRAAKDLQIGRTTLYRRIREFDLIDYIQVARKK